MASELNWPIWIGVVCDDLEAQRRFYRDVLRMEEIESGEGWISFKIGENLFELLARTDEPQYDRPRYQVGFAVDDIQEARRDLVSRGVEPLTGVLGGPESHQYWSYFRDAGGNVFEIVERLGPIDRPKASREPR